jgi:hypothetical protein
MSKKIRKNKFEVLKITDESATLVRGSRLRMTKMAPKLGGI